MVGASGGSSDSLFLCNFEMNDEAVLAEVWRGVGRIKTDTIGGTRSDGKVGSLSRRKPEVERPGPRRSDYPTMERARKRLLAPVARASDEALLSVRRQFAPPSVDSGSGLMRPA